MIFLSTEQSVLFFYASNEPKSVFTRDLGDCRDNHKNYKVIFLWLRKYLSVLGSLTQKKNI